MLQLIHLIKTFWYHFNCRVGTSDMYVPIKTGSDHLRAKLPIQSIEHLTWEDGVRYGCVMSSTPFVVSNIGPYKEQHQAPSETLYGIISQHSNMLLTISLSVQRNTFKKRPNGCLKCTEHMVLKINIIKIRNVIWSGVIQSNEEFEICTITLGFLVYWNLDLMFGIWFTNNTIAWVWFRTTDERFLPETIV